MAKILVLLVVAINMRGAYQRSPRRAKASPMVLAISATK